MRMIFGRCGAALLLMATVLVCCDNSTGPRRDEHFSGILFMDANCNILGGDLTDFLPRPTYDPPNTSLSYACPNPVEGELTTIHFQLAQSDSVWLLVYDRPRSRPIDTLYSRQSAAGLYSITWRNYGPSGIYRVVMRTESGFSSYGDVGFSKRSVIPHLEVDAIEGRIGANLMPQVPPDPIYCILTIELRNKSDQSGLRGLTIPSAGVYLASSDELLGEIQFESISPVDLRPLETDTIAVMKLHEEDMPFSPPCYQDVYLKLEVRDALDRTFLHQTQRFYFECVF